MRCVGHQRGGDQRRRDDERADHPAHDRDQHRVDQRVEIDAAGGDLVAVREHPHLEAAGDREPGERDHERHAAHTGPQQQRHERQVADHRVGREPALRLRTRGVEPRDLFLDLDRRVLRRLEHQPGDQIRGFGRRGIEGERATGSAHRLAPAVFVGAAGERGLRGADVVLRELATHGEIAITVEKCLDDIAECAGRAEPLGGIELGGTLADRIELGRRVGTPGRRSRVDRLQDRGQAAPPDMQRRGGGDLVEDAAERVDIGGRSRAIAGELLRCHVRRGSQDGTGAGLAAIEREVELARRYGAAVVLRICDRARDAPVEHVDLAEVAEHDVRRLEIAVDDPFAVCELDREADVGERAEQPPPRRDLVFGAAAEPVEQRGHRRALQPLHHEVRLAASIERQIVDRHHGGMLEAALHPRLAHESRQLIGRRRLCADPLDRDLAADLLVEREHDLAHPALPEQRSERVALPVHARRCTGVAGASPERPGGLVRRDADRRSRGIERRRRVRDGGGNPDIL